MGYYKQKALIHFYHSRIQIN